MKNKFCQREHNNHFPEQTITSFCIQQGCDKRFACELCNYDYHNDHLDCLKPIEELDQFIANQQQKVSQAYEELAAELNWLKNKIFSNIYQLMQTVQKEKVPLQAIHEDKQITEELLSKLVESQSFQSFYIKPIQDLVHNLTQIHMILQYKFRISRIYLDVVDKVYQNGTYSGEILNGLRDGIGKVIYNNGDIYTGEWRNDVRHGTRLAQMVCGDSYEGEFKNDTYDGQGTYKWADGGSYEGSLINGYSHGYGRRTYENGDIYEGVWQKDNRSGIGEYIFENGSYQIGQWVHDMKQGVHQFYNLQLSERVTYEYGIEIEREKV